MRDKKKMLIIMGCVSIVTIIITVIGLNVINPKNETYTYEWVEEVDSSIGQYILYVNDSKGNHIDGTVRITYLNGKSEKVEIDKDGVLYVKSAIKSVSNPNKKEGR